MFPTGKSCMSNCIWMEYSILISQDEVDINSCCMSLIFAVHYCVCYNIEFFSRLGFIMSICLHQWEGDLNKKSPNENQGPMMNLKMKLKVFLTILKKSIGNTPTRLPIFVDKTGT